MSESPSNMSDGIAIVPFSQDPWVNFGTLCD